MLPSGRFSLGVMTALWSIEHAYALVLAARRGAFDRLESERASHSARSFVFSPL